MINFTDIDSTQVVIVAGLSIAAYFVGKRLIGEGVEAAAEAVNPVNRDNIFHSGVNALGASLTGDDDFSLGSFIFDVLNDEPEI